ncbi:transcription-repair coupling factor [Phenylobacterium deserti]|uniref:Transcription-repair-coupling factor n=1 Tax=Phenylobacterium deserti TaxID=1914756 RepID=A0A328ART5_9CAUL|nr:DEAD/DEAH box helicase [Phenylobacterium deserti]RAK56436.1 DEAD/DEAH box helicase [Phenylobacterium deserti]
MDRSSDTSHEAPAHADAVLAPAPAASAAPPEPPRAPVQPPPAAIAARLTAAAREAGPAGLIFTASSERRADEIGRAARQLAPDVEVLVLPPWDCLPYDRASPSRESMGRRMAVICRLAQKAEGPRLLVSSPEALMQRAAPAEVVRDAFLVLTKGDALEREAMEAFAQRTGYLFDDRIDEPGEMAILGEVIDVFPAAADRPVRITLAEGRIAEIKHYDPISQRTEESVDEVVIGPASELILDPQAPEPVEREPGLEHRASEIYGTMQAVPDLLPKAQAAFDLKAQERCTDVGGQIAEAYEARRVFAEEAARPIPPGDQGLYMPCDELLARLGKRRRADLREAELETVPKFALDRNPGRAFSDFVQDQLDSGARVALAGLAHERRLLTRAIQRGLGQSPDGVVSWAELLAAPAGSLHAVEVDPDGGFVDRTEKVCVVAAADVLGSRVAKRSSDNGASLIAEPELRVGDVVIHEDHGLGVLRALERIEVAGEERDAVRIEYHGGASVLAPVEEFGRIWRYGSEEEAVTLDRLHTDSWNKRRLEISAEIDRTAAGLVELAKLRGERKAEPLEPPKAAYARFAARFPFPETPDQSAAIAAMLEDLASGRPMNRLVCGDVGFGKTEVALRAAAAAALAGKQVAIVAPTTVLARQHFHSFRRRFSGFGIEVAHLSRLVTSAEAKQVKAGLADGTVRVVVGTHALAGKDVAFADLGLLIIDEEQRFGAKIKQSLKDLKPDVHLLTMTATPIPRTLQLAMIGIEDVSVIATPPARRRPIRTFLTPFDSATLRTALMREKRRGGQSFFVVPRIEDMEPMAARLAQVAPELKIRAAHGEMPADEVDETMVAFAEGDGDVLLATNIIESGLDVPRANTMLVWRADRFGLAQLHQLRGRVGRGRQQGVAYLLTDPAEEMADATRARLNTLVAFDRLGSGLAISARDLDLRGAGDLVGEDQAGHMQLIGAALYQRLLAKAVRIAKGEDAGGDWTAELNLGVTGSIPEAYVPDPTIRINLYARLARLTEPEEVDAFGEELEDRFGALPPEAQALLSLARLQALAVRAKVIKVDAGPKALALTLRPGAKPPAKLPKDAKISDERIVFPDATEAGAERLEAAERRLDALAG